MHTLFFVRERCLALKCIQQWLLLICSIVFCSELKHINHKVFSVTDQHSYPGLAGTLDSLSSLSLSACAPRQLWVCPASQRETSGMHWTRERGERGAAGTYQSPGDQHICSMCLGFDLSWALNLSTVSYRNDDKVERRGGDNAVFINRSTVGACLCFRFPRIAQFCFFMFRSKTWVVHLLGIMQI